MADNSLTESDRLHSLTPGELTDLLAAHNAIFCALNKAADLDSNEREDVIRASCTLLGQAVTSILRRVESQDSQDPSEKPH